MAEQRHGSRKYRIALISLALSALCFVATGFLPALAANYGTFIMALGMILGLYGGANVANKHILGRHGGLPHQGEETEELEINVEQPKEPKP